MMPLVTATLSHLDTSQKSQINLLVSNAKHVHIPHLCCCTSTVTPCFYVFGIGVLFAVELNCLKKHFLFGVSHSEYVEYGPWTSLLFSLASPMASAAACPLHLQFTAKFTA